MYWQFDRPFQISRASVEWSALADDFRTYLSWGNSCPECLSLTDLAFTSSVGRRIERAAFVVQRKPRKADFLRTMTGFALVHLLVQDCRYRTHLAYLGVGPDSRAQRHLREEDQNRQAWLRYLRRRLAIGSRALPQRHNSATIGEVINRKKVAPLSL